MAMRKIILSILMTATLALWLNTAPAQAESGDAARVQALRTRIAALNEAVQQVEDIAKIQRLQRAYGYYVDKGYWGEAADLFADEGSIEVGVDGVYKGRERVRRFLVVQGGGIEGPGLKYGQLNMHMQLQPVVTVTADGQTAYARWRDFSLLGEYHSTAHWGDAIMENAYIKEAGVWKILSVRVYTNFVAPYKGGWARLQPVSSRDDWQSDVVAQFPPDAGPTVTYKPFPDIFVPPFHYARNTSAITAPRPESPPQRPDDALGILETRADAEELKLARLHSERAIENLQAVYGYYIDKGMWTEAASLFTRDGSYEFGQSGVYQGSSRVRQALTLMGPEGLQQGQLNNYPMLQPIITVAGDNATAKGRWRSDVQLAQNGEGKWGAGVYENEYVNDKGVWKISKLHYYVTMWADYEKGWFKDPLPMAGASEKLPPDAPPTMVYQALPKMAIFPYHYNHPVTGKPWSGE